MHSVLSFHSVCLQFTGLANPDRKGEDGLQRDIDSLYASTKDLFKWVLTVYIYIAVTARSQCKFNCICFLHINSLFFNNLSKLR